MKTSKLITGLAAAAMAVSSVSAIAGTRAGDAVANDVHAVKMSSISGDVARSTLSNKDRAEIGGPTLIILLIAGIITVITVIVATNNNEDRSPGS